MDVDSTTQNEPSGRPTGLGHRVTSALTASFAVFVVARLLQVAFLATLARLLSPADFGIAAAAAAFLSIVTLVAQMGVGSAIIQAPVLTDRTINVANTIVLGMGVLFFGLMEISAPLVAAWFRNDLMTPVVQVVALAGLAFAVAAVPQGVLTRGLRARDLALIDLAGSVAGTALVAIPMAILGWGYWALVAGLIVQTCTRAVLVRLAARRPFPLILDLGEIQRLWARGAGFSLVVLFTRIASQADRFIVGRYLPITALGLYSRANSLMGFPETLYGQVVERVAFPAIAQVQNERERLRTAYMHGLSLVAVIGMPLTVVLVAVASELVRVVLGSGWQGVIWPFRILGLAMYFRLSVRVGGTVLRGVGQPYLLAAAQLAFAVLTVAGCLFAVRYGLIGICAAVVAATSLNYALVTFLACRRTGLSFVDFVRAQLNGLACGALALVVAYPALLAARRLDFNAFETVLAVGAACGLAALGAVMLAPRLFLGAAGNLVLDNLIALSSRFRLLSVLGRLLAKRRTMPP
jgi:O-antigen/teichoic acid export membrane protein